jgi:hypothetical protein
MNRARKSEELPQGCEVIDFDDALLDSCSPEERADLLIEARILAIAFGETGSANELERMAHILSAGERDAELGRAHARKIAAALKRLATSPWE